MEVLRAVFENIIIRNFGANLKDPILKLECLYSTGTNLSIYGSTVLFVGPGRLYSFLILYTVGRTPLKGDQPVARPLPTHRTTQTHKKTHTDIHASSGIRTPDPSVRAS
jgi:hypothetical protein